jgi:hypothetical protein
MKKFKIGNYIKIKKDAYCPSYDDYVITSDNLVQVNNISLERNKTYIISKIIVEFNSEWLVLNGVGRSSESITSREVSFDPGDFIKDIVGERKKKLEKINGLKI